MTINLVITPGTLDPKQDAPGWIPGWGHVSGAVARDLITAGTTNPATRWCVTQVDPRTGQAGPTDAREASTSGHHQEPARRTPDHREPDRQAAGNPGQQQHHPSQGSPSSLTSLNLKMETSRQPAPTTDTANHVTTPAAGCST